jgi:putative ABC transport system permease protein
MRTQLAGIALRNVFKNKRRSILNMMTFAVSVFVLLMGLGMVKGQFNAIYERIIDLRTGHLKIYNKAYPAVKSTLPLDLAIDDPNAVVLAIKNVPHIKGASPRLIHDGLISNMKKKTGVLINGVDEAAEKNILTVYNNIEGSPLPVDGGQVLIGRALAKILDLKPGSPVLLFSQTVGNMNNLVDAGVSGVYSIGFDAMEKSELYVPLAFAQRLCDMENKATEIIIRLDRTNSTAEAKTAVAAILAAKFPGLTVVDWKEENADLFELAKAKMSSIGTFAGILLFLSFFIIVNTMTMSVFERTPEVGTLRAIGFDRKNVRDMFMMEGFFLSIFGVLLGYVLAAPFIYYLNVHGLVLDVMKVASNSNMPMTDVLKAYNTPSDWIMSGLVCIIAGVLGSYFPAKMASDTNIVKALQRGVR